VFQYLVIDELNLLNEYLVAKVLIGESNQIIFVVSCGQETKSSLFGIMWAG
jgi:hypothetical protein